MTPRSRAHLAARLSAFVDACASSGFARDVVFEDVSDAKVWPADDGRPASLQIAARVGLPDDPDPVDVFGPEAVFFVSAVEGGLRLRASWPACRGMRAASAAKAAASLQAFGRLVDVAHAFAAAHGLAVDA